MVKNQRCSWFKIKERAIKWQEHHGRSSINGIYIKISRGLSYKVKVNDSIELLNCLPNIILQDSNGKIC